MSNPMDLAMTIVLCASFAGALWIGWKLGDLISTLWEVEGED